MPPSPLFALNLPAPCLQITSLVMSVPSNNNGNPEPQQVIVAGGSDGSFSVIASILGNQDVEFALLYVLDFHTWKHKFVLLSVFFFLCLNIVQKCNL